MYIKDGYSHIGMQILDEEVKKMEIINLSKYEIKGCLEINNPEIAKLLYISPEDKNLSAEDFYKEKKTRASALAQIASDANASHAYIGGSICLTPSLKVALREKGITPLYPPYEEMLKHQMVEA